MGKLKEIMGTAADAASIFGTVSSILGIGEKRQDERQLRQQKKLNDLEAQGNKGMMDYQQQLAYDMWEKTNYKAQVEQLEKAGLNPGLMYGMGGGGGTTTGGGGTPDVTGGRAADAAQSTQANTAMGMMLAQQKLIDAQTEKTKAETAKISGVDTREGEARAASTEFQNAVNKAIGVESMWKRYETVNEQLETEQAKRLAEYTTWQETGYEGKATDDPTSPLAKAMKAGLEKATEELKAAKLENNIKAAEGVVKRFEAGLAEQGIHPQSPWYVKILGDLLNKIGISPIKAIGGAIQ